MFEIICGQGGIPIAEFWKIKNIRIAEMLMLGVERRSRTAWEVGRVLATIQVNAASKQKIEPQEVLHLPWMDDEEADVRSEEERQKALEQAIPVLDKLLNMTR